MLEDTPILQPDWRLPHESLSALQEGSAPLGTHDHQVPDPPQTSEIEENGQKTQAKGPGVFRAIAQLLREESQQRVARDRG